MTGFSDVEQVTVYPIDEGFLAGASGKTIHTNPYKSPNIARTDGVKSDAWIKGFYDGVLLTNQIK